ncbi:transposase [Pasteuria penetrans]|uniref:transposase n=1 Tax=Pasteuria penetrans TaxID=86005 RepID=UPI000FB71A87|nr:transposase [Pasteuria penetrans]
MKKKRYTMELKKKIVKEALHNGNVSEVARNYGLVPRTVRSWVKQYKVKEDLWEKTGDKAKKVSLGKQNVSHKTILELREQIYQLKEQLKKQKEGGQLRIDILEDLVKKQNLCPKNRIEVAKCWMRKGYSQNKTLDIINVSKYAYRKHKENQGEIPHDGEKKVVRMHSGKGKGKGNVPGYALDEKERRISNEKVMDIVLGQIT